ncbi:protein SIEVE ELEMENT OCCLUSION A-like [Papaver somniferum]|uniref:protein SIEVE ELEMENT OCCLUSION A-like n=1 Tax=Papaver somniferum TaxID=3469 RepID=UPI000E704BB6|nr:protein SIEVE ELEMENT OCCLUSION A-like [Papaver somniferum]
MKGQCEVIWIPIVDKLTPWTEGKEQAFEALRSLMSWFTIHHPSLIDQPVIRYIKEIWHLSKKPILVVLDPHGRVVCLNALHMMSFWGILAFPLTRSRQDAVWKEETWRLELLMDGIDPTTLNWIAEGRFICMYGGEDMELIRKFTATTRVVAQAARIPLELVYVGKRNPRERARKNMTKISLEKLSYYWQDLTSIWLFWVRLESMWYSKMQLGKTIENDPIMQEIMTMLSFDGSEQQWALFSRGTTQMAKGKGEKILTSLTQFDSWKVDAEEKGFLRAMNDHLHKLHTTHHCNRLVLPGTIRIPEVVFCAEYGQIIERFMMYRCFTD